MANPDNALARHLVTAFTLLIIYASLHPFSGWRDLGAPPLAWLGTGWLRYTGWFDITLNIIGYLPFGFLWATVIQTRFGRVISVAIVVVFGAALSTAMETTQNFLPTRVPSNLDLAGNTAGAMLGAIAGARWGYALLSGGRIAAWREQWIAPGFIGDSGLVLAGLWLLTQVNPESLLFGNGDLRRALGIEPALPFDAARFAGIEAAIAGINTLAVGLVLSLLRLRAPIVLMVLPAGALIRAFAAAVLVNLGEAVHWVTSGNMLGILAGCVTLIPAMRLASSPRRVLAAVALLLATILVNLAPQNPYLANAVVVWHRGHFLNFNGLTWLLSMLWPFLALTWLVIPEKEQ